MITQTFTFMVSFFYVVDPNNFGYGNTTFSCSTSKPPLSAIRAAEEKAKTVFGASSVTAINVFEVKG